MVKGVARPEEGQDTLICSTVPAPHLYPLNCASIGKECAVNMLALVGKGREAVNVIRNVYTKYIALPAIVRLWWCYMNKTLEIHLCHRCYLQQIFVVVFFSHCVHHLSMKNFAKFPSRCFLPVHAFVLTKDGFPLFDL